MDIIKEKPIIKIVMLKGVDGESKLINQEDGSGISFWIGTLAEYQALENITENCLYYITDETADDVQTQIDQLANNMNTQYQGIQATMESFENALTIMTAWVTNTVNDFMGKFAYDLGDTGQIQYSGAGYVTSAAKEIYFSVPLPKYLDTNSYKFTGTVSVKLRQNGNYVGGSSAEEFLTYDFNNLNITPYYSNNFLRIELQNSGEAFGNATNNDVIGVDVAINYIVANI